MKLSILYVCVAAGIGTGLWFSSSHIQAQAYGRHALSPALQARVDRASRLLEAGQRARRAGDLDAAEKDLQECIKQHTAADAFAQEELGLLYETEGRTGEAIQNYHDMIYRADGVPPGTFGNVFNRIHYVGMLNEAGRWPEAVQAYKDTLKNPDMPYNQEPSAINTLNLDEHFNPATPQPTAMRAMLHVALGQRYGSNYAKALPQFEQAVTIDPSLAVAHFYKGNALQAQGHYAEARKQLQQAAMLDAQGAIRTAAQKKLETIQAR